MNAEELPWDEAPAVAAAQPVPTPKPDRAPFKPAAPVAVGEIVTGHCLYCDGTDLVVEGPKGPHAGGLRCMKCERHARWLTRELVL